MAGFIPLILIFGLMYVLMIRPQQKKVKAQQTLVSSIQSGDEVVLNSGIFGVVKDVDGAARADQPNIGPADFAAAAGRASADDAAAGCTTAGGQSERKSLDSQRRPAAAAAAHASVLLLLLLAWRGWACAAWGSEPPARCARRTLRW